MDNQAIAKVLKKVEDFDAIDDSLDVAQPTAYADSLLLSENLG